jgi:hypothetical protein
MISNHATRSYFLFIFSVLELIYLHIALTGRPWAGYIGVLGICGSDGDMVSFPSRWFLLLLSGGVEMVEVTQNGEVYIEIGFRGQVDKIRIH